MNFWQIFFNYKEFRSFKWLSFFCRSLSRAKFLLALCGIQMKLIYDILFEETKLNRKKCKRRSSHNKHASNLIYRLIILFITLYSLSLLGVLVKFKVIKQDNTKNQELQVKKKGSQIFSICDRRKLFKMNSAQDFKLEYNVYIIGLHRFQGI